MNKKILAAFVVTILTLPAAAQGALQLPPRWQEAVHQRVDYSTFAYAMQTLDKSLLLTIPVTKQYFPTYSVHTLIHFQNTASYRQIATDIYPSTAGCKAYALDENWVIAGGTCLWNARHTIDVTPKSVDMVFATGLVEPNLAKELQINGSNIEMGSHLFVQPHEYQVPHIILVRVPASSPLNKRLKNWPKINIFAFEHTTPAHLQGGKFYINTARFGLNASRQRNIQTVANGVVTLQDNIGELSGVSTDPLMYIKNGQLHWIGVNQGITNLRYDNLAGDWDGEPSNDYFYFNKADADFIKQTISTQDPAAWQRIEARKGLEIL